MIPPPYRRSPGLSTAMSSVNFGVFLVPPPYRRSPGLSTAGEDQHHAAHGASGLWNIERAGTIP